MVVSYHYFVIFAEFLGDGLNVDAEQLGHCFLRQPKCLVSIIDVDTHIAVLVLIEYDAVLILLYFVFLHCSFAKLLKSFHILALPYYLLHLPSNILHQYSIQKPKMFHISHLFWWRDVRIKSHFASKLLSVLYIHLSITTQGLLLSLVSFSIKPFFRRKESSLSIVRFDMPNSFANLVAVMSPSTLR